MSAHAVEGTLLVFAVGLLIGGFAIHVGARFALASEDYAHAVLTALLGAVAWALVDYLLAWAGVGGRAASLVGLVTWALVVRWRYSVGWLRAGLIGVVAWIAALLALFVLSIVGVSGLEAYGVPGS